MALITTATVGFALLRRISLPLTKLRITLLSYALPLLLADVQWRGTSSVVHRSPRIFILGTLSSDFRYHLQQNFRRYIQLYKGSIL